MGGQVAAKLQEALPRLKEDLQKQLASVAAADAANTKREVTVGLEKKMHAALDAALVTLRSEAAETAKTAAAAAAERKAAALQQGATGEGGQGAVVGELRREFDDMRAAIKRNAQWLLQAPTA